LKNKGGVLLKSALYPLQVAIYNRLKADTSLKVYDQVPEKAVFPYVSIGEDTVTDNSTKTEDGEEITHTLHVYSSYNGRKEVKELMSKVLEQLTNQPLELSGGFVLDDLTLDMMQVLETSGTPLKHGVMRFRFKITHGEV
jgi:Protein of unknown function (DUF3168)